jgi:hypothetical protein|tara:strand:+ start:877 stop:1041 length:165 start_codon:yes stop_codon:yes gene_type:complete
MKTGKAICHKCKQPAKLYYKKKWWCALISEMGSFNMVGSCKNIKIKDNIETNND